MGAVSWGGGGRTLTLSDILGEFVQLVLEADDDDDDDDDDRDVDLVELPLEEEVVVEEEGDRSDPPTHELVVLE